MALSLVLDGAIADSDREAAFVAAVLELVTEYRDDLSTVTITTDHSGSPDLLAEARADEVPAPAPADPPPAGEPPPVEPPPVEPPLPTGDPGTPGPGALEGRVTALETKVDEIATQVAAIVTAVGADEAADTALPPSTFPPPGATGS